MRESELLSAIARRSADLRGRFAGVLLGPGDDCALLDMGGNCLATVDQVIESRHFRSGTPVELIARKAIARSVSDIAAMAGTPVAALGTGALPREMSQGDADRLFESMKRWAEYWECPLVGGDIATLDGPDDPMVLTVTVLGRPHAKRGAVLRSGARPGDLLCVTGSLGGSFDARTGLGRHLEFEPRLEAARKLADALGPDLHAMMDLSDGLGRDAGRMAQASGVRAVLHADALPLSPGVGDWKRGASDGEDYELLFAASEGCGLPEVGAPLTVIGRVTEGTGCVFVDGGKEIPGGELGWEHV